MHLLPYPAFCLNQNFINANEDIAMSAPHQMSTATGRALKTNLLLHPISEKPQPGILQEAPGAARAGLS